MKLCDLFGERLGASDVPRIVEGLRSEAVGVKPGPDGLQEVILDFSSLQEIEDTNFLLSCLITLSQEKILIRFLNVPSAYEIEFLRWTEENVEAVD